MSKIIWKMPPQKTLMHPSQRIWCDATLNLCDIIKWTLRMGIHGDVPQARVPCGDPVIPLGPIFQEIWSSYDANWANFDLVGYTSEIFRPKIWSGMIFVKSMILPGFDFEPSMPHVGLWLYGSMQDFAITTGLQISDFGRMWVLKKCYGVKIAKFAMITGQFVKILEIICYDYRYTCVLTPETDSRESPSISEPRAPSPLGVQVVHNKHCRWFLEKWVLDSLACIVCPAFNAVSLVYTSLSRARGDRWLCHVKRADVHVTVGLLLSDRN